MKRHLIFCYFYEILDKKQSFFTLFLPLRYTRGFRGFPVTIHPGNLQKNHEKNSKYGIFYFFLKNRKKRYFLETNNTRTNEITPKKNIYG